MNKIGKIILYFILSIVLLIVILAIVAAFSENRIAKIALEQVKKTTDIPFQIEHIEFSLIHDFPHATIRCKNLLVNSQVKGDIAIQDTLAFIEKLYISVDVKPLLKNVFNVRKIEISKGSLFYKVDLAGTSNIDFLLDTTEEEVIDTTGNIIFLDIKDFTVENVYCYYIDEKQIATADVLINKLNLSGLINNEKYKGEAEGNLYLTNCSYDTTKLYLMNQASIGFNAVYDEGLLTLNHASIAIDNDVQMNLFGSVGIDGNITAKMMIKAEKLDLGGLFKYFPENYLRDYGIHELSGLLAAEASISGMITDSVMPSVDATFQLSEGILQYQNYPLLSRLNMNGKASNGELKNNVTTSVDISSLTFQTAASNFNFSGKIRNLDYISYQLKSIIDLDLEEINEFVPDTFVQSVSGKVKAQISTTGTLPDSVTGQFIQSVLAQTQASISLFDVNAIIDSSLSANKINVEIEYQPNQMAINSFSAEIPSFDLKVKNMNAVVNGIHAESDLLHAKISSLHASLQTYEFDIKKLVADINGDITKPDSLEIKIDTLSAESGNNKITLSGTVKNPMAPDYSVSGKIDLNLEEIKKYLPDSMVNSMSGKVSASFKSAASLNLHSISNQINQIFFEKSNFCLNLVNVDVDMVDSVTSVTSLSGKLKYHSDILEIEQFKAKYFGMELGMDSIIASNIYSAIVLNQPKEVNVFGNFSVDKLDYSMLAKFMEEDTAAISENDTESINFTYKINGNFKTNSIKYEDAFFTEVNSKFLVKNNYYVFDNLQMNAFNGKALSSAKIEMKENNEMDVFFKTNIQKMDATKIMQCFGKYIEYEDVKSENVQGLVSTVMDGKIVFQNFEPDYGSLLLNGDLTIENGALINVIPVMEVGKIPGIGLKNLDKLYFSTLNSSLFLFENELYIPRTEIRSTSFDAMFFGMYSFGVDYSYHIRMFLGEVLTSKSKANLKKLTLDGGFSEEDEKDVTKGRTSIYVVSKSENDKEKAGFDNKRDRLNMIAKVNLQKQMVDMSFHPALVKYNTEE